VEDHYCVRRRGSHSFYRMASQMAVTLSALRVGCALPLRKIPGTYFCLRLSKSQGLVWLEELDNKQTNKNKPSGLSPQANYTDRATVA
jgi:hypothetical protein